MQAHYSIFCLICKGIESIFLAGCLDEQRAADEKREGGEDVFQHSGIPQTRKDGIDRPIDLIGEQERDRGEQNDGAGDSEQ